MDTSIKIPCTFFSTDKLNLFLPNSAIAEVLINQTIEQTSTYSTDNHWIVGELQWQNNRIIIIDFDTLGSKALSNTANNTEHTREKTKLEANHNKFIVIIRNPGYSSVKNNTMYFGLSINKIPHVIEANAHNLDKDLRPHITHTYAASYATINNKAIIIPNINLIVSAIEESIQPS